MRLGIALPNVVPATTGPTIIHWARRAEHLGFDAVAVIDRIVYDSFEPLVALTLAAAVTERVELVTNVLIAPQRGTGLLAKQAASLERASGGRLTLGLAVGLREDDFAVTETPMRGRGTRFDEQLGRLGELWSETAGVGPAPVRSGGPPLLIGGEAAVAAPRVARHGAGWTMMVGTPEQFADGARTVRDAWGAAGRTGQPRLMAVLYAALGPDAERLAASAIGHYYAWLGSDVAGWIASTAATDEVTLAARIDGFAAAGADEIVLVPCSNDVDQLNRIAAVVLPGSLPARLASVPVGTPYLSGPPATVPALG